jgi:hypothetical protein
MGPASIQPDSWIDWVPVDGAFGEWFLQSVQWSFHSFGEEGNEPVLEIRMIKSSKALVFSFRCPALVQLFDEHEVANEPGYKSYHYHSLYLVPCSRLARLHRRNPYYLLRNSGVPRPSLTHFRIVTLDGCVDVLTASAPVVDLQIG